MADPISAGSPKAASPKAPAKLISAGNLISKITSYAKEWGLWEGLQRGVCNYALKVIGKTLNYH